jgi:hypothetical protein
VAKHGHMWQELQTQTGCTDVGVIKNPGHDHTAESGAELVVDRSAYRGRPSEARSITQNPRGRRTSATLNSRSACWRTRAHLERD